MSAADILNKLYAFKTVDKYEAFQKLQPGVVNASALYKETINILLDVCCRDLIALFELAKKPTKLILKQTITRCMNKISKADLDAENRDFGYELCWFLAEKVGLELKRTSENRVWGYWKVNDNEVIPVSKAKRKEQ